MKKITVMTLEKYSTHTVEMLRKIGLLHVDHMQTPHADYITAIENKLAGLLKAVSFLKEVKKQKQGTNKNDLLSYEKEIISLGESKQKLANEIYKMQAKLIWFKEWGNISLRDVEELKEKGVFLKLYLCSKKELKKIVEEKCVKIIKKQNGTFYIALVSRDEADRFDFVQVQVPKERKSHLEKKIISNTIQLEQIEGKILELSEYKKDFLEYKEELLRNLEFYKVRFGMINKEGICCLRGFCPLDAVSKFEAEAKTHGWAILVEDSENAHQVPTLIRYPRWVKIIKPIFDLMSTLPGYKEYDISLWFLLFFSLFFAMLIGDAGYGLLFLGTTVFARKKMPKVSGLPFFLMYVLSISTIVWGAVTGNWFGCEQIAKLPFFKNFVISGLNTFVSINENTFMQMCFIIAAVQLSLAHGLAAIRKSNSLVGIAQLGWISIISGIYFLVNNLVLDKTFPEFANYLLIGGISLVIVFSNFQKNIIKGMAIAIANLPLKLISSFADVLSYLRLFAIGYVSVMIAASFNEMAQSIGFSSIITALGAGLILLAGHMLNIVLGLMSVLVHGVRLNMLEFSGHLNMEWSGREYKPFRE